MSAILLPIELWEKIIYNCYTYFQNISVTCHKLHIICVSISKRDNILYLANGYYTLCDNTRIIGYDDFVNMKINNAYAYVSNLARDGIFTYRCSRAKDDINNFHLSKYDVYHNMVVTLSIWANTYDIWDITTFDNLKIYNVNIGIRNGYEIFTLFETGFMTKKPVVLNQYHYSIIKETHKYLRSAKLNIAQEGPALFDIIMTTIDNFSKGINLYPLTDCSSDSE